MNNLRNRVQLIGRVGTEPEIRTVAKGKTFARLNLATNETYINNNGERVTETQWHNLIAWDKNAILIQKYLRKGQEVAIEGKLTSRNYQDKEGVKRYITEVIVHELLLLGGKKE